LPPDPTRGDPQRGTPELRELPLGRSLQGTRLSPADRQHARLSSHSASRLPQLWQYPLGLFLACLPLPFHCSARPPNQHSDQAPRRRANWIHAHLLWTGVWSRVGHFPQLAASPGSRSRRGTPGPWAAPDPSPCRRPPSPCWRHPSPDTFRSTAYPLHPPRRSAKGFERAPRERGG
jgi:hypothetical protein